MSRSADRLPARRWLRCDHCDAQAWIGVSGDHRDGWCESCQCPASLPDHIEAARCEHCGEALTLGDPRFEELYGTLQNLVAVLESWSGDSTRLAPLVPERPRFLTDLDPPESSAGDSPAVLAALAALRAGAFELARARLEALVDALDENPGSRPSELDARLGFARGIARQRLGHSRSAQAAYGRVLEIDPGHSSSWLNRGALRAMEGRFVGALMDFQKAGERKEAKWNRIAVTLALDIGFAAAVPSPELLELARKEAGPPSPYWSDHTVGRLLFSLFVERTAQRAPHRRDPASLRSAEREMEFDTFDDRALVLLGYATLGIAEDVERVAAPLAERLVDALLGEPFVRGEKGVFLRDALHEAVRSLAAREPAQALVGTQPLLARSDLRHYRIPCARCAQGTVGVDQVEDSHESPSLDD